MVLPDLQPYRHSPMDRENTVLRGGTAAVDQDHQDRLAWSNAERLDIRPDDNNGADSVVLRRTFRPSGLPEGETSILRCHGLLVLFLRFDHPAHETDALERHPGYRVVFVKACGEPVVAALF